MAGLARGLLGGEILGGAHDLSGGGQRNLVGEPGDAEVGDLHPAVGRDQQVSRLDVAVNESLGVGNGKRLGGLGDDVTASGPGESTRSRSIMAESGWPGTSSITR